MDDHDIYSEALKATRAGRRLALATVVRVKGSTPREAGSKMLIGADGELMGTIGGGCGEAEVLEAARTVLATGRPRLVRVDLTESIHSWSPAVCGGVMDVFVEALGSGGSDLVDS